MKWGIRFVGVPEGTHFGFAYHISLRNPWEGWWLGKFDPEAYDGLGSATFVEDAQFAMRFEDFQSAKDLWWTRSVSMPMISDEYGVHENRPLAVVSIAIDEIP